MCKINLWILSAFGLQDDRLRTLRASRMTAHRPTPNVIQEIMDPIAFGSRMTIN
jgi:hypothetical protein